MKYEFWWYYYKFVNVVAEIDLLDPIPLPKGQTLNEDEIELSSKKINFGYQFQNSISAIT